MGFIGRFRRLTPVQRNTFIACFLGWALDAFDFFILALGWIRGNPRESVAKEFVGAAAAMAQALSSCARLDSRGRLSPHESGGHMPS